MKRILFVLAFLLTSSFAYSQISFGVSTDFSLKGTTFGYKFGNFMPYLGLQYYYGSLNTEFTGKEYDYETNSILNVNYKTEISGGIFLPSIGVKYLLDIEDKTIKPFVNASFFKAFLSADAKIDGIEEKDITDVVEKTSIMGFEFGIGAEYYFQKNFCIGGEFGFRYTLGSNESDYEDSLYDPEVNDYIPYDAKTLVDLGLGMTFTRINLTYFIDL